MALLLALAACSRPFSSPLPFPEGFIWGTVSPDVQVEGSAGLLNQQMESDIQLLRALGVTHHAFSLSWRHILPDGMGAPSSSAMASYSELIDHLLAAGIQPVVTLYEGDLPRALMEQGGWSSPAAADWFARYAEIAFRAFGDRVPLWITVRDPMEVVRPPNVPGSSGGPTIRDTPADTIRHAAPGTPGSSNTTAGRGMQGSLDAPTGPGTPGSSPPPEMDSALDRAPPFVRARRQARAPNPAQLSEGILARQASSVHHLLLAHARAVERYRSLGYSGSIGLAIGAHPVYPSSEAREDVVAARREDAIRTRWLLDPLLGSGAYPVELARLVGPDSVASSRPAFSPDDLAFIRSQGTDFLGVDYYAPLRVAADSTSSRFGIRLLPNPDVDKALGGEAFAKGLSDFLVRVDSAYGHPPLYVTANGTGFGPMDEVLENGRVRDELRVRYLRRHLVEAARASAAGVDLRGYFLRSAFDHAGQSLDAGQRWGIIHIDPDSGTRTFKDSARYYSGIVKSNAVSRLPF